MDRTGIVSNARKLLYRCDCLLSAREGHPRPVMFLVSPTNRCQLDCPFCLYGDRDKALTLPLADLLRFVDVSECIGVKTWELTGGGEPLLYPNLTLLLDELHRRGFAVGMMTNGLALDRLKNPEFLRWIRISLHSGEETWRQLAENVAAISGRVKVTFAYTATLENIDQLPALLPIATWFNWTVKVEPDWFALRDRMFRHELVELLNGQERVFIDPVVSPASRASGPCYLHLIKPFLYTDGWLYPCACAIEGRRDVQENLRLCRMEDVAAYYAHPPKSLTLACPVCKYEEHNRIAEGVLEPLEDPEFC